MIHHLDGKLSDKPAGRLIVEVGGVEMEVHVSALTWNDAGRPGDRCRLLTHLSVRETDWTLFGFLEEEERELFRLLLGVQGIVRKPRWRFSLLFRCRDCESSLPKRISPNSLGSRNREEDREPHLGGSQGQSRGHRGRIANSGRH